MIQDGSALTHGRCFILRLRFSQKKSPQCVPCPVCHILSLKMGKKTFRALG